MTATEFKQARKARGMNQRELARWLGVSYSAVTKWETNRNPIPSWVTEKLGKRSGMFSLKGLSAGEVKQVEVSAASQGKTVDELVSDLVRASLKLSKILAISALPLDYLRHYLCSGQGTTWETALAETGCDALAVAGWTCDKGGDLIAWAGPRIGDIMGSIIAAM